MENMASSENLDVMETSMMSQSSMLSATGSMSMREKSQLKRRINKEHNSNFRAGYVPVNETYLHKAGIRGRKRLLLYGLFVVFLVIVVLNTALTAWLMWIYHITHRGVEPWEFTHSSAGYLLRFLDPARFQSLLLLSGTFLGSRHNTNLTFTGVNSKFVMSTSEMQNDSMVEIEKDVVRFSLDDLKLRTSGGKTFLSLSDMKVPHISNLKNLHAQVVETTQVKVAPDYDSLNIESYNQIQVNGSTGVRITSKKETEIHAKDLHLISRNGTVVLNGRVVIKFINVAGVPKNVSGDSAVNAKLCVCGNTGLLFTVPVWKPGVGCANVDRNPCMA